MKERDSKTVKELMKQLRSLVRESIRLQMGTNVPTSNPSKPLPSVEKSKVEVPIETPSPLLDWQKPERPESLRGWSKMDIELLYIDGQMTDEEKEWVRTRL